MFTMPMFCSPILASQKTAGRNRGTGLKRQPWLCHMDKSLQTASPCPVSPLQLASTDLMASHLQSLRTERRLQGAGAACGMSTVNGYGVLRRATRNLPNHCCYSRVQVSLRLDCRRDNAPRAPPTCRDLAKPLQRHLVARLASPPETTEDARVAMKSKGLMILLVHPFDRYFPQRKSFRFLCFYCKYMLQRGKRE